MNKENILALAEVMEGLRYRDWRNQEGEYVQHGFNMTMYRFDCGTPACVAGYAASLSDDPECQLMDVFETAQAYLGLDRETAVDLFFGDGDTIDELNYLQPQDAADTLRKLAETGEVSWRQPGEEML